MKKLKLVIIVNLIISLFIVISITYSKYSYKKELQVFNINSLDIKVVNCNENSIKKDSNSIVFNNCIQEKIITNVK